MKKEYLILGFIVVIHWLTTIVHLHHNTLELSDTPLKDALLVGFHTLFFICFTYLLLPRFFQKKKFLMFAIFALLLFVVFSYVDEEIIEKILYPKTQGGDSFSWSSPYWFFTEIAVPLMAFVTVKLVFDNFENQNRLVEIKNDSLRNELKFLKSQIQPHVLFNSLNNLYEYTLSKSDKAPDLVLKLSNVLRYFLYEIEKEKIALQKELQFLEEYIGLQELLLENRGSMNFNVDTKKADSGLQIAPFVLIPFVENSFKHSLNSLESGIEISISIHINNNALHMQVINNFEKLDKEIKDLTASGIGHKNIQKRLLLLYPNNHRLDIEKSKNRYCVNMILWL